MDDLYNDLLDGREQVKLEKAASASRLQYGHSTPITVAALLQNGRSGDSDKYITCSSDGVVRCWFAAAGAPMHQVTT
jgi:hypothetical protein